MISFEEVTRKLKAGNILELKFNLIGGLYSRHLLSYDDGFIRDESFVDGSVSKTTIAKYKKSFYGKAFTKNAVQLIEEINT
jgi:hypothetical protein